MKRTSIAATSVLFAQLAAGAALACGGDTEAKWVNPGESLPKSTITEASASLKALQGVIVEKSNIQSRCSSNWDFTVKDANDGQYLGTIPVPQGNDGRFVIARTEQLLGGSKEAAKARATRLEQASRDFYDDVDALEAEWGVRMYDPNALPLEERFPGGKKQLMYVVSEHCTKSGWYMSADVLSQNTLLNTTQLIPGRLDYSEGTVYKSGDAKKALFTNPELFKAFKERAADNVAYCTGSRARHADIQWAKVAERLNTEDVNRLLESTYDRYMHMLGALPPESIQIERAQLVNRNTIEIGVFRPKMIKTFDENDNPVEVPGWSGSVETFSGASEDILKIERDLAARGVKTNREDFLDMQGKWQKEDGRLPAPLPLKP